MDSNRSTESKSTVLERFLENKARVRITDLQEAKRRGEKWSMLTCYDTISARIFDHAKIPVLLVGDSCAQTVYGYKSTIPVTMDEMISLARAVSTSCERALVVADLPFGSYQESPQAALRSAARFMKEAGAHAVKLEGGKEYCEHVKLLTQSGVPVMAHIGFTPQSEHALGGFKVQGRDVEGSKKLIEAARSLQEAGAFACVIEMAPSNVARSIREVLNIPLVGIGAGPHCDAQVLVWQDMVGLSAPKSAGRSSKSGPSGYLNGGIEAQSASVDACVIDSNSCALSRPLQSSWPTYEPARVPKFVKRYANVGEILFKAAVAYREDVRNGSFPGPEHCYE